MVCSRPDLFRVLTPPAFALTVLTVIPPDASAPNDTAADQVVDNSSVSPKKAVNELDRANEITKLVHDTINAAGEIYLTCTAVNGIEAIRVVSANPLADEAYLRKAFEILVKAAERARVVKQPMGEF